MTAPTTTPGPLEADARPEPASTAPVAAVTGPTTTGPTTTGPTATKRRQPMTNEEMVTTYPSLSVLTAPTSRASRSAWIAVFRARPDVMHSILADFIKQSAAAPGRIGQRPMPQEADVDFQALVYGEQTDEPLTAILPKLMRVSERAFCARIHMSRSQFQRLLRGEYDPDVNELRLIAAACRKPPAFFVEYRKIMAVAAFINLLEERPGLATTLYRQYLEVRLPTP